MLDPDTRAFGLECLQACGEKERVQRAHAQYYLHWAERNRKKAFGSDQQALIQRYVREQWNWRSAMQFFLQGNDAESVLKLAGGLSVFWGYSYNHLYVREGVSFLAYALKETEKEVSSARAWALGVYGGLLSMVRDERSEALCREGLALARQVGDRQYIIACLWMLLLPLIMKDDFTSAHEVITEVLALAQEPDVGSPDWGKAWLQGYSFHRAGYIALWQGRYAESRAWLRKTVHICEQESELFFALWSYLLLGEVSFYEEHREEAREQLEQSVTLYRMMGIRTQAAEALSFLGLLSWREGKLDEASVRFSESLHLRHEVGDEQGIAWAEIWFARVVRAQQQVGEARVLVERGLLRAISSHSRLITAMGLEELGYIVALQGEAVRSARLFGASGQLREVMGIPRPALDRPEYEARIAALKVALGTASFQKFFNEGRKSTAREVISMQNEVVSTVLPPSALAQGVSLSSYGLTRREREVFRLLARGLTNVEIAGQLKLSPFTVNAYLRTLYTKMGVSSRTQAVHVAFANHLIEE